MNVRTSKIIAQMKQVITSSGFNVLTRYPGDIKLDENMINKVENSACKLAWCVGDTHTHLQYLGIHTEDNGMLDCYTNLSIDDKFFQLVLMGKEDFKLTELSREKFIDLKTTRVPYSRTNEGNLSFVLKKDGESIVNVDIVSQGTYADRSFKATLTELSYVSEIDRIAAERWASHSIRIYSLTLFFKSSLEWKKNDSSSLQTKNQNMHVAM